MAYWITLKKGVLRNGFQADTAQKALDVLLTLRHQGHIVRVVHPEGYEVSAELLTIEAKNEARNLAPVDFDDLVPAF